jgi:hypothetical protein
MQPIWYMLAGMAVCGLGVFFVLLYLEMRAINQTNRQAAVAAEHLTKIVEKSSGAVTAGLQLLGENVDKVHGLSKSEDFQAFIKSVQVLSKYAPQLGLQMISMTKTLSTFTDLLVEQREDRTQPSHPKPQAPAAGDSGFSVYDEEEMAQSAVAEMLRRQGTPLIERPEDAPAPDQVVAADS